MAFRLRGRFGRPLLYFCAAVAGISSTALSAAAQSVPGWRLHETTHFFIYAVDGTRAARDIGQIMADLELIHMEVIAPLELPPSRLIYPLYPSLEVFRRDWWHFATLGYGNVVPALRDILAPNDFGNAFPTGYPTAVSFMVFLIERYGFAGTAAFVERVDYRYFDFENLFITHFQTRPAEVERVAGADLLSDGDRQDRSVHISGGQQFHLPDHACRESRPPDAAARWAGRGQRGVRRGGIAAEAKPREGSSAHGNAPGQPAVGGRRDYG